MANNFFSKAERLFIVRGIQANWRSDGRHNDDYRCIEVDTNVLQHADGSAAVRIGATRVIVSVKLDIGEPTSKDSQLISLNVDCSSGITDLDHSENEAYVRELGNLIESTQLSAVDTSGLWLVRDSVGWLVHVDAVILELAGNVLDAISIGIHAALRTTRAPRATVIDLLGEGHRIELDETVTELLPIGRVPLVTTVSKIQENAVIDLTADEERCAHEQLLIAAEYIGDEVQSAETAIGGKAGILNTRCRVLHVRKIGTGCVKPDKMVELIKLGATTLQRLTSALEAHLSTEPAPRHLHLETYLF